MRRRASIRIAMLALSQLAFVGFPKSGRRPHGGSDFLNSTVVSDTSAASSGTARLRAAIATSRDRIARANAPALAATYRFDALYMDRSRCFLPRASVNGVTESQGNFVAAGRHACRMLATVAAMQRLASVQTDANDPEVRTQESAFDGSASRKVCPRYRQSLR
jgi:hypothetical protein